MTATILSDKPTKAIIRLYLAGPMSGLPDLNFPAFHAEATRLRALGFDVVNPAEINGGADELVACAAMTLDEHLVHWRHCMRKDIAQLLTCDGIALLSGWERSKGASLENHIAVQLGMIVCIAAHLVEGRPLARSRTDWAAA